MPENQARRLFLEMKQVLFTSQFAVIPLLRLFQAMQVLLQCLPVRPGSAVDALQHFITGITAPVSASQPGQFERGKFAGTGHVRTAAQVNELTLPVQRQFLMRGNGFDDLCLVLLSHATKECNSLIPWHDRTADTEVLLGQFHHFFFDCGKVIRGKRPFKSEIVIKTVFDNGADCHLCLRKQFFHRLRHQMSAGVAQYLQACFVPVGNDAQGRISVNQVGSIDQAAVHFTGQGRPGQAGPDVRGNIQNG